ncbi:STAS domain-containing protein [Streptomyces sp. CA-294286]|uniref:STAS domain-containing protein n=1 Tax=Streptomyces sp. CA-294286 TaxID=3240070 RepID=UPI003D8C3B9F
MPFRLTLILHDAPHRTRRCLLLTMPGEIDLANYEELYGEMRAAVDALHARIDTLVLDFTGTAFMDSRGARLVSATREHAVRSGVAVRLAAGGTPETGGAAYRVITLTGIRRDLPVYGTVLEAVEGADELELELGDADGS